jgi:hypothetical protein
MMILKILKLLSGAASALVRCVRPMSSATRVLFVASGVAMTLGGLGAARDDCPRAAAALVAAGLFLAAATLRLGGKHAATTAVPASASVPLSPAPEPVPLNPKSPASRLRAGWCQGALARDREGRPVFPRESAAAAWSLLGAVAASHDAGTTEWVACFARLRHALGMVPGDASARWLAEWNDDPSRTQADAVAAAEAVEGSPRV